jgi:hypothetical protein
MVTNRPAWQSRSSLEAAKELETDLERGLTAAETAARLKQFGPNELVEQEGPSFWNLLLDQFNQFLVIIILIVSAMISFARAIGWTAGPSWPSSSSMRSSAWCERALYSGRTGPSAMNWNHFPWLAGNVLFARSVCPGG